MSAGPTDRRARRVVAAAVLAAAAAVAAPPPAPAADRAAGGPVFFRNPDPETARAIRNAIGLFGNPAPSDRERARDALADIGAWSVPPLLEVLREGSAQFRSNATLVLFRLPDRRAPAPLRAAASAEGRGEWPPTLAVLALGRLLDGDPATFRTLAEASSSRDNERRKVAVALAAARLARRHPAEAGAVIDGILDTRSALGDVRDAALLAVGFLPGRTAELGRDGASEVPAAPLRAALKDGSSGTRLSAVLAMAVARRDAFHSHFVEAVRTDGDPQVRNAALLAMGARRDDETTDAVARVLELLRSTAEERATAAHLLARRADARALDALVRTATASSAPDIAAAAVIALGGMGAPRATAVVRSKLSDRNAQVRAAAAVACTRFGAEADLVIARREIEARLVQGEPDVSTRFDMKKAVQEIGAELDDRAARARGEEPPPRKPATWSDSDAGDLARAMERDERDALLDLVNRCVHQVLGVGGLFDYRPGGDPAAANPDTADGSPYSGGRPRREHSIHGEAFDLRNELLRRPYFTRDDLPEMAGVPQPRDGK
jgi:hypothetical protein